MDQDTYAEVIMQFVKPGTDCPVHWRTGMLEELGEVARLYCRRRRNGADIDVDDLVLELGDLLFYATMLARPVHENADVTMLRDLPRALRVTRCGDCGRDVDAVLHLIAECGFDANVIRRKNVEKLSGRVTR